MSLETTAEITGLKQALSELSKLDKSARFKAAAKIKASSPAMLEEGRKQFPFCGFACDGVMKCAFWF